MITIGLLTPTYNRLNELKRLAKSIVNQKSDITEWVIIDDGSTDGTYEWCQLYLSNVDFNIKVIRQNNSGKSQAVKVGLRKVTTDYVGIIDSDDELTQNALGCIKKYIGLFPGHTSFIGYCTYNNPLIERGTYSWEQILNRTKSELWGVHRTTELRKFDFAPYYPKERFNPEYNIWARLNYNENIFFVNEPLRIYNREVSELSRNMWRHVFYNPRSYFDYFTLKLNQSRLSFSAILRYHFLRNITRIIIYVSF